MKALLRGFSGGEQLIKAAKTSNRGRVCLFPENAETTILVSLGFDKFYGNTAYCEKIYDRYCI